ncbi:MAG: glycosyltransferase family 1 protein [Chitinophagaceae bacterium]|nr:MAG: glycosyltransferase family 1 protein [Chitinophagaceae bacterium]
MNIGFDAKRAYHNHTGLGYYSRTLVELLARYYPEHRYFLFNPKPRSAYSFDPVKFREVNPSGFPATLFRSAWRSSWVTADLKKLGIDLYHGLSHEIPVGISNTRIRSVVTIHDLIHERYPKQYKAVDRRIYTGKYKYACRHADHIIAISEQTKRDLMEFYKVPPEKITVCYQSASPLYGETVSKEIKSRVRTKYNLPNEFFLSVGTINERKNLLNVCKAMYLLRDEVKVPLVVIGKGSGSYYTSVKDFILQHDLEDRIIFLSEDPEAKTDSSWLVTEDMPGIYQQAIAMLYPSYFEGFGVPVIEALSSQLPVITSNVSCLPEVGGDAAYYVNPASSMEIADGMKQVYTDENLRQGMKIKGVVHALGFTPERYAASVMDVYQSIL